MIQKEKDNRQLTRRKLTENEKLKEQNNKWIK